MIVRRERRKRKKREYCRAIACHAKSVRLVFAGFLVTGDRHGGILCTITDVRAGKSHGISVGVRVADADAMYGTKRRCQYTQLLKIAFDKEDRDLSFE